MAIIEAILFDVGNVLIEWDPRHLYRKLLPDEAAVEYFLAKICTSDWHLAHDQGVSFEENAILLKRKHPDQADLIDQWGARYMEMAPGVVAGMGELVAGVQAAGLGVHGLTNMPSSIFPLLLERFSVMQHLETVVVSGDEGICKPEPRIFDLACERMGLAAEKVLFVDDSLPNIKAAAKLGFHAHHFTGTANFEQQLAELGVNM